MNSLRYPLHEYRWLWRRIRRAMGPLSVCGHAVEVEQIQLVELQPGFDVPAHIHAYYEAHLVLVGALAYEVGGTIHRLSPPQLILQAPHVPHNICAPDTICRCVLFTFNLSPSLAVPPQSDWPALPTLITHVDHLFAEAQLHAIGWQERVMALLTLAFSTLISHVIWRGAQEQDIHPLVASVDRLLSERLSQPLTLEEIAHQIGVSRSTLCRHYSAMTGETVMAALYNLRMEHAYHLLIHTDLPAAEVGRRVGVSEPSYFSRLFRERFHLTPRELRKLHLNLAPHECVDEAPLQMTRSHQ